MNPIVKMILGAVARHWLGTFLAVLVGRDLLPPEAKHAAGALSDDMVSDFVISLIVAVPPIAISIVRSLRLKLRERLALRLHPGATERHVKDFLATHTLGSRVVATLTANPARLSGGAKL